MKLRSIRDITAICESIETANLSNTGPINKYYKFLEDDRERFTRIPGYCSPLKTVIGNWINHGMENWHDKKEIYSKIGDFLSVPFNGNLFEVKYDKPIIKTPWDMFTPSHPGEPWHKMEESEIQEIINQPTYKKGFEIYTELGYPKEEVMESPEVKKNKSA